MSCKLRTIMVTFAGLAIRPALVALLLPSCGSSALQADLFSVDFVGAPYPVMLSPESACAGRRIQGKSGDYSTNTKYHWEHHWNVMGASQQVQQQVGASDNCVQIEQVAFDATIERGWSVHKLEEELTIGASVGP